MKLFLALLVLAGSLALSRADDAYPLAQALYADPKSFYGKDVEVECVGVAPRLTGPQVGGMESFWARIIDPKDGGYGGYVIVMVMKNKAQSFAKRYGLLSDQMGLAPAQSKKLGGRFRAGPDNIYFIDYQRN